MSMQWKGKASKLKKTKMEYVKWILPTLEYKLNTDGSYTSTTKLGGIGVYLEIPKTNG